MTYKQHLINKNFSNTTITTYLKMIKLWNNMTSNKKLNKQLFTECIKKYHSTHSANSTKLFYYAILNYLKYQELDLLISEVRDIKLPSSIRTRKRVMTFKEFEEIKSNIITNSFLSKRNWLIFTLLYTTGIRSCEISQIKLSKIKNNHIKVTGKGSKERSVYLCDSFIELFKSWPYDKINIKSNGNELTYKQLNLIIKSFSQKYLGYCLKPHDLRSSYATHLLKNNINIKIVAELLGHANLETTSRYLHFSSEEIHNSINTCFI
ncbi:MAG: tyrosine-type recombinase/integrase [Mycoplasma sp.]